MIDYILLLAYICVIYISVYAFFTILRLFWRYLPKGGDRF